MAKERVDSHVGAVLIGCVGSRIGDHEWLETQAHPIIVDSTGELEFLSAVAYGVSPGWGQSKQ